LFENRFYTPLQNSVKWYFSAVANIHGLQIDYYEKQLDVSPHQSFFKSPRVIDVGLKTFKCEIVLFFEGQQVFISVGLSCRRGGNILVIEFWLQF